jgi:hypothetical protein
MRKLFIEGSTLGRVFIRVGIENGVMSLIENV